MLKIKQKILEMFQNFLLRCLVAVIIISASIIMIFMFPFALVITISVGIVAFIRSIFGKS
jgi:hypothetical protein